MTSLTQNDQTAKPSHTKALLCDRFVFDRRTYSCFYDSNLQKITSESKNECGYDTPMLFSSVFSKHDLISVRHITILCLVIESRD